MILEKEHIKNIPKVLEILKREKNKFKRPFVSEWAEIVRNPFTTLISCILSLRTKDNVTAKASLRLLRAYDTPEKILKLKTKQIEILIYPVGFYKIKAKRIKEISRVLIEKYNGRVPDSFDELMKLRGVGPKTASIVVVYGHKKPNFIPTDIHVFIVSNRLGWVKTKTPEQTMDELMQIIPKRYWYDLNELFVQFGQNICITISPFCSKCPINKYCLRIGVIRSR